MPKPAKVKPPTAAELAARVAELEDQLKKEEAARYEMRKVADAQQKKAEKAEAAAIKELTGKGGPRMVRENAKQMRWVYRLLPRVDDSLIPLGEVTYKQCKERFKREYINEAIQEAEGEVRDKFQSFRNEEKQFVKEEILINPWEEAQDPEAKAKALDPPSRSATHFSKAKRVGFWDLAYSKPV